MNLVAFAYALQTVISFPDSEEDTCNLGEGFIWSFCCCLDLNEHIVTEILYLSLLSSHNGEFLGTSQTCIFCHHTTGLIAEIKSIF